MLCSVQSQCDAALRDEVWSVSCGEDARAATYLWRVLLEHLLEVRRALAARVQTREEEEERLERLAVVGRGFLLLSVWPFRAAAFDLIATHVRESQCHEMQETPCCTAKLSPVWYQHDCPLFLFRQGRQRDVQNARASTTTLGQRGH